MILPEITLVFISIVSINKETLLEMHICSIMILIIVMHSFTKINSNKTPVGVHMIQSQVKVIKYPPTWTLKLCLTPCIFSGKMHTVTKINHIPYQTIQYDDKGMFPAQLMDNTPIQVFIDNGATPSILPLSTYNKHPILQKYPKTKSTTPIHTGEGTIESHFWIELPLKLENQTIQIKILVCDSECPYNILIGRTSLAHLSTWQDYARNKLCIQQISIPIVAKNNVRILPGCTGIVSAALKTGRSNFIPRNTIVDKGVAYIRPFDKTLPLRPIEIEIENNKCCLEIHNSSDSTVKFFLAMR